MKRKTNWWCRMFGHVTPLYGGTVAYGKLVIGPMDGIGRTHAHVEYKCERCHQPFVAANVHMPHWEEG